MAQNKQNKLYKFIQGIFSRIGKRKRFIFADFLMSLLLLISTFYSADVIPIFIPIIVLVVFVLTFFAILEGISKHELFALFVHPVFFSIVFYVFYFFLPQRWLTRAPFIVMYGVSM